MTDIQVSSFQHAKETTPVNVSALSILQNIKTGTYRKQIERLRTLRQQAKSEQYDKLKKTLLGVTWAGVFTHRSKAGFQGASGLFPIDLDHVPDVQAVKTLLMSDKSLSFAFISPGGDGIKAAYHIPGIQNDTQFKQAFSLITDRVKQATGLSIDESRKDISGLCFVSYDPELYINQDAQPIVIDFDDTPQETPQAAQKPPTNSAAATPEQINRWIQWKVDAAVGIINQSSEGTRYHARMKAGTLLGGVVSGFGAGFFSAEDAFQELWPAVQSKTQTPQSAEKNIRDGISHGEKQPFSTAGMQAEFDAWKKLHPRNKNQSFSQGTPEPTAPAPPEPKQEPVGKASAIANLLKPHSFAWHELHDRPLIDGKPLTDDIFSTLFFDLVNKGVNSAELVEHVITREAAKHRHHPVKEFLNGLQWDNTPQIEKLGEYFEDTHGIFTLYLRKWLIGAVDKAYTGAQNPALVFVSAQGLGKHFLCKWLCSPLPEMFVESAINPDSNDHKLRLIDRWIWEISEMGGVTHRVNSESLKSFLTLESITARRPYARYDTVKNALASFIGTVNPDGAGFLTDTTGNRRFRPVTLTAINRDYATARNVSQVWAEAVAAYRKGETAALTADEEQALKTLILPEHEYISLMQEMVEELFEKVADGKSRVTRSAILNALYAAGYKGKNAQVDGKELSQIMQKLGYEKFSSSGERGFSGIKRKKHALTYTPQTEEQTPENTTPQPIEQILIESDSLYNSACLSCRNHISNPLCRACDFDKRADKEQIKSR